MKDLTAFSLYGIPVIGFGSSQRPRRYSALRIEKPKAKMKSFGARSDSSIRCDNIIATTPIAEGKCVDET